MAVIAEILVFLGFLLENCTGVALIQNYAANSTASQQERLIPTSEQPLEDFTQLDPADSIFQEYDPPDGEEEQPKSWEKSLPSIKMSLWQSLESVLLIQTIAGTAIGLLAVFFIFIDLNTVELCSIYEKEHNWNALPISIQRIRAGSQAVEGFIIELWDFLVLVAVFPWSVIKELNLLVLNLLAAFTDMTYRLYFQVFGIYHVSWMSFPLNALFILMLLVNNYILGRHFFPDRLKTALKMDFILSAQFLLGLPAALFLVYVVLPWYIKQEPYTRAIVAAFAPLITAIPKVVVRLGAQKLNGIVHPGAAHVLVAVLYAASALVFRIMQGELSQRSLFVALGIAHGIVDLFERITITMRDEIWECLYRLLKRDRRPTRRFRSLRSRRFIADVSIHIMLQESAGLVGALGYIYIFEFMHSKEKPYADAKPIYEFLIRSIIGLAIDLFFNTISVFIQTRVMNVAVNRVWRAKWRYHMVVNAIISSVAVLYFSGHLFEVVRSNSPGLNYNCTEPPFF